MMPELMSHHVFLRQWSTAGAELITQHIEEAGVEVGSLIHRAVERAYFGSGRTATGVDLTAEQPDAWAGVAVHQLLPHRIDGVAGGDHPALHVLVGVGSGFALTQIESWPDVPAGAGRWQLVGDF